MFHGYTDKKLDALKCLTWFTPKKILQNIC